MNRVRGTIHDVRNKSYRKRVDLRSEREGRIGKYTARQIKPELNLKISVSRVRELLHSDRNLIWLKMKKYT